MVSAFIPIPLLSRHFDIFKTSLEKKPGRKLKIFKFLKVRNVMKLHSPSLKQNILSVKKMVALFALETHSLFAFVSVARAFVLENTCKTVSNFI